jgi:hypothetical protein
MGMLLIFDYECWEVSLKYIIPLDDVFLFREDYLFRRGLLWRDETATFLCFW